MTTSPSQCNTHTDTKSTVSKSHIRYSEHMVRIADDAEVLEVIREEQNSPMASSVKIHLSNLSNKSATSQKSQKNLGIQPCYCDQEPDAKQIPDMIETDQIQDLLNEKEKKLRAEYDTILLREIASLRERFDFILQNEQMRASYMLREAHRERQEKIRALESQLECKNLAALMYVMCAERSRSKLEKLQLIEEYTTYIRSLQDLLIEGQQLIISLSRGYKTAARVDNEWRCKMKKVVTEFMNFIYHFAGGPPETNQFLIDLPKLLKTSAPIEVDPKEDPWQEDVVEEEESNDIAQEKSWWETLEGDSRPFVMFGDMCDFKPPQRRQVLKTVKATNNSVPKFWKKYVFNDIFLKRSCENADEIKNVYPFYEQLSILNNWDSPGIPDGKNGYSRMSLASRRQTVQSIDFRCGDMGSILKIITSANASNQPSDKAALLGARDSMEITSTTKLRQLSNNKSESRSTKPDNEVIKLHIGKRHASNFDELLQRQSQEVAASTSFKDKIDKEADKDQDIVSGLGSLHHDSLDVMLTHKPDKDHKINYERVCPMEECQRMQVDSFMRSLPPYMRANPFTHFQQTFDAYETCTPEQLEILKQRLATRKTKELHDEDIYIDDSPLKEWDHGIATQTSMQSLSPPCTCVGPNPTPVDSNLIFDVQDLIPVKLAIDAIQKECLYDDRIDFDRFKLVGQESNHAQEQNTKLDFKQIRSQEITKILKEHPSLLDIFQANAQC